MPGGGETPVGPAVEDGRGRVTAGSVVPVPVLSCKTAGKRYLQVSPDPAAAGHCSALLPLENNLPELGFHRLPAVMRRGRRGTGESCEAGEKLPSRSHFWSSLYSYRPIFPSLATTSLQGKKLLCTKNKCDPSARIRPGSRGQGQRARPGPAGTHWPREAPNSPRQRKMEKSPFTRRALGTGPERGRPRTKPTGPETRPEAGCEE